MDLLSLHIQGGNKMKKIKIMNEFLHSPLWYCDDDGIELYNKEAFDIFVNDKKLQSISNDIEVLFNSYYKFDSHNQACWFNNEQEKLDKQKMLDLLNKLNKRLNELNDGTFEVEDLEMDRVKNL